ncbi:hypothetical protein C8R43DRAFT_1238509 [Mycena crocata]|nr:hypothetical protein C8R43DRAFT_1238509 [Mycena crocata]
MAMEGELLCQVGRGAGRVVKRDTSGESDKRTLDIDGFYVLLLPYVESAGSSSDARRFVGRRMKHTSWRTFTKLRVENNGVFIPADSNTPALHLNEFAVPEVRVQPPPSSDEGPRPSESCTRCSASTKQQAARKSLQRCSQRHAPARLTDGAAPTLLNPGDLDRELDERASFLAVRELILAGDPATMDFLRDPLPSPAVAPRRPLAPRMLNLTDVLDLPQEFEFKAHVRGVDGSCQPPLPLRCLESYHVPFSQPSIEVN